LLPFTAINFYFVPSGNRHFRNNQVAQWLGLGVLFSESVENKNKNTSHLRQRVNTLGERMPHGGQIIRMNA